MPSLSDSLASDLMDFRVVPTASSKIRAQARLLEKAEKELLVLSKVLSKCWGISRSTLDARIRVNPRLVRSVARYRRETGVIELGLRFFRLRARRTEVLCHELAHVAVHRTYGKSARPHGREWRQLVASAGFVALARLPATPGRCAEKTRTKENPSGGSPEYRLANLRNVYEHRCPVCQTNRRAKRPVSQWRCANCVAVGLPGTINITRIVHQ